MLWFVSSPIYIGLRAAMEYLLANPKKAAEMGANARKRTETLFSADKQAQSYFELYQSLLA